MTALEHETSKNFNRKFPRYNVAHFEGLAASMGKSKTGKLISVGQGGCGFYSVSAEINVTPPQKVSCLFRSPDLSMESFEVLGELVYVRPYNVSDKMVFYYGIEFLQAHQLKMQDLAKSLEELADQGSVIKI